VGEAELDPISTRRFGELVHERLGGEHIEQCAE